MNFSNKAFLSRQGGFTLVEMLIACALFALLTAALVAMQLFAARVYTLAATKLTATAGARKIMNQLRDDIKSAAAVEVGIYDPTRDTFAQIPDGAPQMGNALLISPTNDLSVLDGTIYFMNPAASNICSVVISNSAVLPSTLANNIIVSITNYYVFDAEDARANIYTNYNNCRIIHVKLQFAQWEYPLANVGAGGLYDYYQLQTRAAQRVPQPTY